jgi:hypothetical protein
MVALGLALESGKKTLPAGVTENYLDGAKIRRDDDARSLIHAAEQLIELPLCHLPGREFPLGRNHILPAHPPYGAVRLRAKTAGMCRAAKTKNEKAFRLFISVP